MLQATIFIFTKMSTCIVGPTSGYWLSFHGVKWWGGRLTSHLHLVLRLRLGGAISPHFCMPSWHVERELYINFTFSVSRWHLHQGWCMAHSTIVVWHRTQYPTPQQYFQNHGQSLVQALCICGCIYYAVFVSVLVWHVHTRPAHILTWY